MEPDPVEAERSRSPRIDLMIVGAQRSGTSALLAFLRQHPAVSVHHGGEFPHFLEPASDPEAAFARAYAAHFDRSPGGATVTAKSAGLLFVPGALTRLRDHNPNCLCVAILRHPVERAYSAYWFARLHGWEPEPTFEGALHADPSRLSCDRHRHLCAYVDRGLYAQQIERLWDTVGRDSVHVLLHEDLRTDPDRVCRAVFEFAGLDADVPVDPRGRHRATGRPRSRLLARTLSSVPLLGRTARRLGLERQVRRLKGVIKDWNRVPFEAPAMEPGTRARLLRRFQESNRRLETMLDRDLTSWGR